MEFKEILKRLSEGAARPVMDEAIAVARSGAMHDEHIAQLAMVLAESGHVVRPQGGVTHADVASTGGPSSLSTLLCPLFLRSFGSTVPKLGVSGRPAGAVDVLAQIPG